MRRRTHRVSFAPSRALAFLALVLIARASTAGATPPPPVPVIPRETVARLLSAADGRSWTARFDAACDGEAIDLVIRVRLVPGRGVTPAQLARRHEPWAQGVARVWSGSHALQLPDGRELPIRVAVRFDGPEPHHRVVVRPSGGRRDESRWNLFDPPALVAHEVGHMLGAYDEYPGGALEPRTRLTSAETIMGPAQGELPAAARHYHLVKDWFALRTSAQARVVAVAR